MQNSSSVPSQRTCLGLDLTSVVPQTEASSRNGAVERLTAVRSSCHITVLLPYWSCWWEFCHQFWWAQVWVPSGLFYCENTLLTSLTVGRDFKLRLHKTHLMLKQRLAKFYSSFMLWFMICIRKANTLCSWLCYHKGSSPNSGLEWIWS